RASPLAGITRRKMRRPVAAGVAVAVTFLVGAAQAAAASPPTATTGPVTAPGPTSATVSGSVNPNGVGTTWYVEYGTSTSYGAKTPAKDAGAGTTAVGVSAPVTGLRTGRTYHFRVVATSDAGTSRGADKTFLTAATPAVTTKPASSVQDT